MNHVKCPGTLKKYSVLCYDTFSHGVPSITAAFDSRRPAEFIPPREFNLTYFKSNRDTSGGVLFACGSRISFVLALGINRSSPERRARIYGFVESDGAYLFLFFLIIRFLYCCCRPKAGEM